MDEVDKVINKYNPNGIPMIDINDLCINKNGIVAKCCTSKLAEFFNNSDRGYLIQVALKHINGRILESVMLIYTVNGRPYYRGFKSFSPQHGNSSNLKQLLSNKVVQINERIVAYLSPSTNPNALNAMMIAV